MRSKYPRTPHVPFSPGATNDDKVLRSLSHMEGKEVVISVKMDGENTTLYRGGFHARSLDSRHHPSRDWLARFHAERAYDIPDGWRICGENLYARHSLHYTNLESFFLAFSAWNAHNCALPWDDTVELFELLDISYVAVLYRGPFHENVLRRLVTSLDLSCHEGVVVRLAGGFAYEDFGQSVAKWVRPNHVSTAQHWMHQAIMPNQLRGVTGQT